MLLTLTVPPVGVTAAVLLTVTVTVLVRPAILTVRAYCASALGSVSVAVKVPEPEVGETLPSTAKKLSKKFPTCAFSDAVTLIVCVLPGRPVRLAGDTVSVRAVSGVVSGVVSLVVVCRTSATVDVGHQTLPGQSRNYNRNRGVHAGSRR